MQRNPTFQDVTILIPLRVDSAERKTNLDAVLGYLSALPDIRIMILEAALHRQYFLKNKSIPVASFFEPDTDSVFYRTYYINRLLERAATPIAGIWDTDVFVPYSQLEEAVERIRSGKAVLSYPYDGRFYCLPPELSRKYRRQLLAGVADSFTEAAGDLPCWPDSVGGAFFVDRLRYLEAGGENEYFYGWGAEDRERFYRITALGGPVIRVAGPLFHLYHPVGENSRFASEEAERRNRQELAGISSLKKEEILPYTEKWKKPETLFPAYIDYLLVQAPFCTNAGLYTGTIGLVLFFFHYARFTGQSMYEDFAEELLDLSGCRLAGDLPPGFGYGLSGIGWALVYLEEAGFLEGDLSDALSELDVKLMRYDPRRMSDTGLDDGLEGVAVYVVSRLLAARKRGEPEPFDALYLADLETAVRSCGLATPAARAYLRYRSGETPRFSGKRVLSAILSKVIPDHDSCRWKPGLKDGCAGFILHRTGI